MTRRTSKRDLSGWTVTGGWGALGREVPPPAGGGVDWSRPRCEPDNHPLVVAGRVVAVFGPILAALPVLWFGLPLSLQAGERVGAWLAEPTMHVPMLLTALAGMVLACIGILGLVQSCSPPRTTSTPTGTATGGSGGARVRVDVTALTREPGYPVGQLVYRVFDSPALHPAVHPALGLAVRPVLVPVPVGPVGRAVVDGRWSA